MSSSSSEDENENSRSIQVSVLVHSPQKQTRTKNTARVLRNVTNKPRRTDENDWYKIDVVGDDSGASATKKQSQPQKQLSLLDDINNYDLTHDFPYHFVESAHTDKRLHQEIYPRVSTIQEEWITPDVTIVEENLTELSKRAQQEENIINVVDAPQSNEDSGIANIENVNPERKGKKVKAKKTRQRKIAKKSNAKTNKNTQLVTPIKKKSVTSIPVIETHKTFFKPPMVRTINKQFDVNFLQKKLALLKEKLEMQQHHLVGDNTEAKKNERKLKNCIIALETAIEANQSK